MHFIQQNITKYNTYDVISFILYLVNKIMEQIGRKSQQNQRESQNLKKIQGKNINKMNNTGKSNNTNAINQQKDKQIQQKTQNQYMGQGDKVPYVQTLKNMLEQNRNAQQIKQTLKKMIQKRQRLTYVGVVQDQTIYLQAYGLQQMNKDHFSVIGDMIRQKSQIFFQKIDNNQVKVKYFVKPKKPQPQPPSELVLQIEHVLNNIDLPLSLFKRNDNYWYIDNPKTIQAKQYLKKLREKDHNQKTELKKKRNEILKQKQQKQNKTIELINKEQQMKKKQIKERIQQKLQLIRKSAQERKKSISQSVQFMKERGKPMFKKIQKHFLEKIQLPILEQKKKKLNQIRQLRRSVGIDQIQSHKEKHDRIMSEHTSKTIFQQIPNVSFKSHFHQSFSSSRLSQLQNQQSLHQKRLQYSRMVLENHKPAIDLTLAEQMESRLKVMNKRRARRAKKPKKNDDSQRDSDEEQEQEEPEEEQQPEPEQDQDQEQDDSDAEKPQKDDQYQPSNQQRYKMGLNYLKAARKLAAKNKLKQADSKAGSTINQYTKSQNQSNSARATQTVNKTINFDKQSVNNQSQMQTIHPDQQGQNKNKKKFVWVSKYDQQEKKQERIKYRNYLHEFQKTNKTIDFIDTSRLKKEIESKTKNSQNQSSRISKTPNLSKGTIQEQIMYQTNLQNQIRHIQEKAKHEQELLRFKRISKQQAIDKKMAIDDVVVDAIKARLSLLNK